MTARIDHLVIACDSLEQGVQWCERTLGVTPAAGGKHRHMGTHNRLLALSTPAFPNSYLELIAVDPEAPSPARPRWFGLDDARLCDRLRERPRLLHAVARTDDIRAGLAALAALGVDAGTAVAAERQTATGLLRWTIAGRDDGALLFGGALPTLIEWQVAHPSDQLPASGVGLRALALGGLQADVFAALALPHVTRSAAAALAVDLATPLGAVALRSDD